MIKIATLIFLLVSLSGLEANSSPMEWQLEPVIVSELLNRQINKHSYYYVDKTNMLSIEEVAGSLGEFSKVDTNNLVLSPEPQTIWAIVRFSNPDAGNFKIFLNFAPSYLGKVDIYSGSSLLKVAQSGTLREPTPDTRSGGLPIPLVLPPGESEYFIRIESIGVGLAMAAMSEPQFTEDRSRNQMIFSFVVGALVILGLYQLFVFVTSRDWIMLHYVLYIFSMVFFQLGLTGYNRYIFSVEVAGFPFGYLGSLLAGNLTILFLASFTYKLLELKHKHWAMKRPFQALIVGSTIAVAVLLASENYISILITRLLGLSLVVSGITVSAILALRKNLTAVVYLFSWAPILLGTAVMILNLSGLVESSTFASWALPFGSVIESLVLAIAIGNRLQKVTMEKIHEQNLRIEAYQQIEENFEKMKARDKIIKTFVSPTILTEVALGRDPISYPPQHVLRTILFTDIRNYTGLTENSTSQESFEFLNYYFQTLNKGIFNNKGEVDKLIGDAVMATFRHPRECIEAYLEFRKEFYRFNKSRRDLGQPGIRFGAGVSYGEVLSANFGSQFKLDRTIVGDEVNVASRYEGLTKVYKVNLLATPNFVEKLGRYDFIRCIDFVNVKGKQEPRQVIEIFSDAPDNVKDYKCKSAGLLGEVVRLKQIGNFAESLKIINELISTCPRHNYDDSIMDPTLEVIKSHIENIIYIDKGRNYERSVA